MLFGKPVHVFARVGTDKPGVLNVGDINKTDGCAQAAALADKI